MNLSGIHLQLLIGKEIPLPAPLKVNEALQSVEITHKDEGRSGFQLNFQIGRSFVDYADYSLLKSDHLKPFHRVIVIVYFGIKPVSLIDGVITNQQLSPSDDPGGSKLTLTGEDVSVLMDLEPKEQEFTGQSDSEIVVAVLKKYPRLRFVNPKVKPIAIHPAPQQQSPQKSRVTDLAFINELAGRHGCVFYVEPGPIPGTNTAYWDKPNRDGHVQKVLSVNLGPSSNIKSISFQYNALAPNQVTYVKENGQDETLSTPSLKGLADNFAELKRVIFSSPSDGLKDPERRARAQGELDKSTYEVVTATGELNALSYGEILKPRRLVDLRGAGHTYNGRYYVKSVTHKIDVRKGHYDLGFTMTREGTGAHSAFVSV